MEKERIGMAVGIITRGTVSIKWMQHMDKLRHYYPVGMAWKYIIQEDDTGWAKNRIEVVKQAQKENFAWLLFIDDDVFVPKDVMQTLLKHQKDIVTGIYWTKGDNEQPVIFERPGGGPMYKFPMESLFEVGGSGLGCCLINMKVFDAFDKANIPYFKENWIMETDDGRTLKCPIGEDHYFFYNCRKLGFKVFADSNCLCDHYDMNKKVFHPSEETVRNLCGEVLKTKGREDIVEEGNKKLGRDPDKETIVFVNHTANGFAGDELERRGLGGSESDVINLSKIFANQYDFNVHVFCTCPRPGVYDNVIYHDLLKSIKTLKEIDIDLLVLSRNTDILNEFDFKNEFGAKKVCLWTHDMPGDPVYRNIEGAYKHFDRIFALTEFHKKVLKQKYPFIEEEKYFVARNGVDRNRFKNRDNVSKVPGRLIYSSTPFRGLDILAEVFPRIREKVPHATLKVFSSMAVYGGDYSEVDDEHIDLYKKLKNIEGIEYSGSIKQDQLAKEFMEAEVLAYPCTFPETCCLTVLEAQAGGTPIVTSNHTALPETAPDSVAIRIDGKPYSKEYKQNFIDAVVKLLTDKEEWNKKHKACLERDVWWDTIAVEWINEFFPKDSEDIKQVGNINTVEYWNKIYKDEIKNGHIRYDKIRVGKILDEIKNGDKILDIGCGTGSLTRGMRKKCPDSEIWGSDFSMAAIDYCRQQDKTIYYANHPLLNKEFEQNCFDVITIIHVLEHLNSPIDMINKAIKLLKPTGKLIISFPINDDEWQEHLQVWQLKDIDELLEEFNYKIDKFYNYESRYKDGRPFEDSVITIKMEEQNG